jgi:hypothetical protein
MRSALGNDYTYVWTRVLRDWLGWDRADIEDWIANRVSGGEVQTQVILHEPPICWIMPEVAKSIVPTQVPAELSRTGAELYKACLLATDAYGPIDDDQIDAAHAVVLDLLRSRGLALQKGRA